MPDCNFIQIHTLHGYSAVLLNRDDSGLAKRMSYGGSMRTRISSQCLKRHWRKATGEFALDDIDGATAAYRSREIVTRKVQEPLHGNGYADDVVTAISDEIQKAVYGDKGTDSRQPLLLGAPEIDYLVREAHRLAKAFEADADAAAKAAKDWRVNAAANLKALRESTKLPGGLTAALFGRMVTADVEANIDAAIHVAHAFTVHEEESESDYFTVVDDLQRIEDDRGADHIGETELTSGLFYSYVVVDGGQLLKNLAGDADMAEEVVRRLVHLIATASPGAKLGSTAPYDFATWMLVEAGNRQPRSLAEAFRRPCEPLVDNAENALATHLQRLDDAYGSGEERRAMSLTGAAVPGSEMLRLPDLAEWAGIMMRSENA